MGFREWGAFSRQSRPRPIAKRAVTMASRKRGTSNGFCCNLGSINLRPVALRPRQEPALPNCHVLMVECEWPGWPGAVPDVLHTEVHQTGFGSLRRPSGLPPRGTDPGLAGRDARTRHNRNYNRQQLLCTAGISRWQATACRRFRGMGCSPPRPSRHSSLGTARNQRESSTSVNRRSS